MLRMCWTIWSKHFVRTYIHMYVWYRRCFTPNLKSLALIITEIDVFIQTETLADRQNWLRIDAAWLPDQETRSKSHRYFLFGLLKGRIYYMDMDIPVSHMNIWLYIKLLYSIQWLESFHIESSSLLETQKTKV